MVRLRWGTIVSITAERPGAMELDVDVDGERATAIAYPELTGAVEPGDAVLLNTTAVELQLGTGGAHFVVAAEPLRSDDPPGPGRVVKARYTPLQTAVETVEETHADLLDGSDGLAGMPVVVAPLHSMIGPAAAGAKAAGARKVAYVMTDGAALPGAFSRLIPRLRSAGLLDGFVTCGQAFGGELEAVTVWTGLLAAAEILGADVAIVADGPGNLGTDTRWGVSALHSGHSLDAVAALGGRPVAALRISFADARERHRGLSHHTRTILSSVSTAAVTAAVPKLLGDEREAVWSALQELPERIELVEEDGGPALAELRERGIAVESMGRGPEEDPAFFLAAGAAGVVAARRRSSG